MITHEQFKQKWLGKPYAENTNFGYQCVAGVKKYCSEVYGVTLGSFGGTAYNGYITGSPFDKNKWIKILNAPNFIPKQGDVIFFDKDKFNGQCGHVGIVDSATLKDVKVLNQNMGNGDGIGLDDAFKISTFNYITPKCLGVYRKK